MCFEFSVFPGSSERDDWDANAAPLPSLEPLANSFTDCASIVVYAFDQCYGMSFFPTCGLDQPKLTGYDQVASIFGSRVRAPSVQ